MWRVFSHDITAFRSDRLHVDLERGMRPLGYHRGGEFAPRHDAVVSLPHGAMVILPEEGIRPVLVGEA